MGEALTKLRPDRDLQCYYLQPSAIAALSGSSATGFTVSGSWRQQLDWVVVEWNRDNVFEHSAFRNLPDGDLSGIKLTYEEVRSNCIPLDSTLYPTVDWPYLRVWAESGGTETIYWVPIARYATPASGSYVPPTARFELQGTPTYKDLIELAWLDQHFNYRLTDDDTLATAINQLAYAITSNQAAGQVTAIASGNQITLTYLGAPGANGNRVGVYGTVDGAGTESWAASTAIFSGGQSPEKWTVSLDFNNLTDINGAVVPTTNVRKLRWTWAADLQPGNFVRSEFSVVISNWSVTGTNLQYSIAGPGSRRIEDDEAEIVYQGSWATARGNFSGGSIHSTTTLGDSLRVAYFASGEHSLFLGTRYLDGGGQITIQIDGGLAISINLALAGEDLLVRKLLGQYGPGQHQLTIRHAGPAGASFYFDFLELAVPATSLPAASSAFTTSLATDWDTLHSQALVPERTAWMIQSLGFHGRANHYAGALWFYELYPSGYQYATGTITFSGAPEFPNTTQISLGATTLTHLNLSGDTAESIATCFALLINAGATGVWASASGATITLTSRILGAEGNRTTLSVNTNSTQFTAQATGLAEGTDGTWKTDLNAAPRLNRAARDWHLGFLQALKGDGISLAVSFSMELGNGDDTLAAGIAQRYPNGDPVWLNTPSLQTNFGLASTQFWQQVYAEMAGLMASAGQTPYLQFGEVQWWYFAGASGMPFYDAYTTSAFQSQYGRPLPLISNQNVDPSTLTQECAFLAGLIGSFTSTIMQFVRESYPAACFEVLYPLDS